MYSLRFGCIIRLICRSSSSRKYYYEWIAFAIVTGSNIKHTIITHTFIQYYAIILYCKTTKTAGNTSYSPVAVKRFYTPWPPAHCTHENTCHVITDIICTDRARARVFVCVGCIILCARWRYSVSSIIIQPYLLFRLRGIYLSIYRTSCHTDGGGGPITRHSCKSSL